MRAGFYSAHKTVSSTKMTQKGKILPFDSDRLSPPMRRRPPVKEVLNRRMKQTGATPAAIEKRASQKGAVVSDSTVKTILRGESQNAGVFTWEAIALGMDIPPLQLISELLGENGDDPQVKSGQFSVLQGVYKELTPAQRAKADIFLEGWLVILQHIKNQSK